MIRHVTVTAERGKDWWVLECAEAGSVSQVRRLSQADAEMREAIAYQLGVTSDDLTIDIVPILPAEYANEVVAAERERRIAQEARSAATAHLRTAARSLVAAGLSLRNVGTIMGVSHQRVAQLVNS